MWPVASCFRSALECLTLCTGEYTHPTVFTITVNRSGQNPKNVINNNIHIHKHCFPIVNSVISLDGPLRGSEHQAKTYCL